MFDESKERALQITEALYRTTELFSDAEPLKWSLRQNALEILNSSPQDLGRVENLVKGLFLKLELAASGTFISKMNFEVLKREYSNLLSKIISSKEGYQALLDNIAKPVESVKVLDKPKFSAVESKKSIPKETLYQEESSNGSSDVNRQKGDRQVAIIAALKEKGPSSVGDLAGVFGNSISGKTIQRELNTMVNSGTIKQNGEKRWRRYFI